MNLTLYYVVQIIEGYWEDTPKYISGPYGWFYEAELAKPLDVEGPEPEKYAIVKHELKVQES